MVNKNGIEDKTNYSYESNITVAASAAAVPQPAPQAARWARLGRRCRYCGILLKTVVCFMLCNILYLISVNHFNYIYSHTYIYIHMYIYTHVYKLTI